jgi:uncharacterized protein YlxP (DUF503 family)
MSSKTTTIVGILTVNLLIVDSNSLKDKRQVVKSLLDGIRNRFNISAAELGELNTWRRAVIGVAVISNDKSTANTVLNHVLDSIESNPRVNVDVAELEFV